MKQSFDDATSLAPENRKELSEVMRQLAADKVPIIPWGSGSHQQMGHPLTRIGRVIHTQKLSKIAGYFEKDLTITIESGTTLKTLQEFLRSHGQFFPYLGPDCKSRTVGGIFSTASYNFLAPRFGQTRDLVLGMSVCLADGSLIKGGGRVVKNVSGYEMPKLFTGAFGTVGFLVDLTLKISPLPEKTVVVTAEFPTPEMALKKLNELFCSPLLYSGGFAKLIGTYSGVALRVDGKPDFVADQSARIRRLLTDQSEAKVESERIDLEQFFPSFSDFQMIAEGAIPPQALIFLHHQMIELSEKTGHLFFFMASPDGAFKAGWQGGKEPLTLSHANALNQFVQKMGGWIRYLIVPERLWSDWPMWGEEQEEWELSRRIKKLFDPNEILNPNRFVGRI